ncbi:hypothetical protein SDC9_62923 [bioreactor metagenome]|uniref:Uncharacterized protein n=1 Tax=bioreactor metagenome TaxID=1076179 RepID=A0A644XK27_9ZZZZ|nr:hypothetical protein [Paludibacter sp.]
MIEKRENKLFLQLSSTADISHFNEISRNAIIEELLKPDGTAFIEINSINHAVILCRDFISKFNIGSSNWRGGLIVDKNFNFIARVSYNGRVWNNTEENWRTAKEITI